MRDNFKLVIEYVFIKALIENGSRPIPSPIIYVSVSEWPPAARRNVSK
jgi:hypothetical protein